VDSLNSIILEKMKKDISKIFVKWNPLSVPDFIAKEEYSTYVNYLYSNPDIEISDYLEDILANQLGIDISDEVRSDILNVSKEIIDILKTQK